MHLWYHLIAVFENICKYCICLTLIGEKNLLYLFTLIDETVMHMFGKKICRRIAIIATEMTCTA